MADLKFDGIILRNLRRDDSVELARMANDKAIWLNVRDRMPFPYAESDALHFIGIASSMNPKGIFGIEFEGKLVGAIGLHANEDVYRFNYEVGYWIGQDHWNNGHASKALRLICTYGFEELKAHRICASVFDHNPASRHVLEKFGFKKEGIKKEHVFKDGRYIDEHQYALNSKEFQTL